MHRWDRLCRDCKCLISEREMKGLTCPAENFVAPERGRIEEMLHQSIVSPEPHSVNHPPLNLFFLLIGSTLREINGVLKDICGVIC